MPNPNPKQDDPADQSRCGPHLEIFTHGTCENDGKPNARAAIGVDFAEPEWDDHRLSEMVPARLDQNELCASYWAVARAIQIAPRDYCLYIHTANELVANTLELALLERTKHDEETTILPRPFNKCWTDQYSYDGLIRRIMQAVQTREREYCYVYFIYAKEKDEYYEEAESLALAALEDYVSEDDEDDARWNDEEGNGRRKKRKMAKREGTTLSEEA